jgi:hypothetical protein
MPDSLSNPLLPAVAGLGGLLLGLLLGYLARSREVKRLERASQNSGCWVRHQVQVNGDAASHDTK